MNDAKITYFVHDIRKFLYFSVPKLFKSFFFSKIHAHIKSEPTANVTCFIEIKEANLIMAANLQQNQTEIYEKNWVLISISCQIKPSPLQTKYQLEKLPTHQNKISKKSKITQKSVQNINSTIQEFEEKI